MEVSEKVYGNRYFIVAVTVIVISYLMWVLSERLEREIVNAEVAAFELRVAEMKAAVLLMEANLVARNDMVDAGRYVGSNPMLLMRNTEGGMPAHYAGEKRLGDLSETERKALAGLWIFDLDDKAMMYFPRSEETWNLDRGNKALASLKFSVIGLRSEDGKSIQGLRLAQVD